MQLHNWIGGMAAAAAADRFLYLAGHELYVVLD